MIIVISNVEDLDEAKRQILGRDFLMAMHRRGMNMDGIHVGFEEQEIPVCTNCGRSMEACEGGCYEAAPYSQLDRSTDQYYGIGGQ